MKTNAYEIWLLIAYLIVAGVFLYLAITDGGALRWVAGVCGAIAFVVLAIRIAMRK